MQNALRRTIDLQKSDRVPFHVLLLPALEDVDALLEWHVDMDQVGLPSDTLGFWFDLYVGAEGHALAPDKIAKSETPAHDAIRIRLTATRMIRLSPLLYVFTRLLSVAVQHERADSIPLPSDAVENLVDEQAASAAAKAAAAAAKKEAAELKVPASRIRKMMLADDEVGKIGQTTPILISKALELFIGALAKEAAEKTKERDAKTVSIGDLKAVVDAVEDYDFLRDVVADFAEGGDEPEDAHAGDDEGEGEQ